MPDQNPIQEAALRLVGATDGPQTCSCGKPAMVYRHGENVTYGHLCEECLAEAEREQEAREEKSHRESAEVSWFESTGIRPRFREAAFERCDSRNAAAVERCRTYVRDFVAGETTGGLMLMGPIGTGKTFLGVAILRALHLSWPAYEIRDYPPSFLVNVVELANNIIAAWKRKESGPREYAWARDTQLLILDDLGLEIDAEWAARELYQLVNHRYEYQLPTIVTTNATVKDLTDRLGARTVSRLTEMCEPLKLAGKDRRVERRVRERADLA